MRILGILFFIEISNFCLGQTMHQNIKGKVIDGDTKSPLVSANVIIENSNPLKESTADLDGNFKVEQV